MANQKNKKPIKFWEFKNSADNSSPPELILYGDISQTTWWDDEVTPQMFSRELDAIGNVEEIIVRINSGGGDVFAANAIYTRLKDHPAKIVVKIDGWAASAATIIAMAGDEIQIPANGVFMIHNPKMGVIGYYDESEFIKMSEQLKVIKQSIVNGYAAKTGKDAEEISEAMEIESWFDGKDAVEAGYCDKIMFEEEVETKVENSSNIVVNSVSFDIDKFNMPSSLLNKIVTRQAKEDEKGEQTKNNEKGGIKMSDNKKITTVAELKQTYPELANEIEKQAIDRERKRIQDIEEISMQGFEDVTNDAKFGNPITASELAVKMIAEQKKQGGNYLADREEDVKNSNAGKEGAGETDATGKTPAETPTNEAMAVIDKLFPQTK